MPRLKLHTDIRRRQIAEATLSVLGRQGVHGLSVAAVARQVGFAPSAIYRHYRSKDQMLDAVLELMRERLHGAVARSRAESCDPFEVLHHLLLRHLRLIRENRAVPRILLSEDFRADRPQRRERLVVLFGGYLESVAEIIREGQDAGVIRGDVSARSLALLFLGLIQPAGLLWSVSDGRLDLIRNARATWPIFEQALRAGTRPARRPPTVLPSAPRRAPRGR